MNLFTAKVISYAKNTIKMIVGERGKARLSSIYRKISYNLFERPDGIFAFRFQNEIPHTFKIGMAVLVHERPEYLELCLDTLFRTKLYNYDITFLIQDDGSTNPRVREIMERPHDPQYKIVRYYTSKGHNSWGAAFNKAIKKLLEIDDFDIVGSCDSDAIFHPEWLDQTMKICLWAKKNHAEHILGPFSSFNSSDYEFHRILGTYPSPYGNYVVKYRMGAVNYFYLTKDLLKLGFFKEDKDDETIMTARFDRLKVRNFCTETSYVEHVGHLSVLNQWRPTPVSAPVYGMNLAKEGWGSEIEKADTLGYYRYVKQNLSFGENALSDVKLDILMPVLEKDLVTLPHALEGIRKYLRHPINDIFIVAPESPLIKAFCKEEHCLYVAENSILPFDKSEINYLCNGLDRSGWLYKQLLNLFGDTICSQENFLVVDADTIYVCPQVFIVNDKTVLLHSDEHHYPYFEMYWKLFGVNAPTHLSFVSHQMLFNRHKLSELRCTIESRHNKKWYDTIIALIDKTQCSGFAEYETYGQWILQNYPEEVIREYWFNISVSRARFESGNGSIPASPCRSISSHHYQV